MDLNYVIEKFRKSPARMDKGNKANALEMHVTEDIILEAKKIVSKEFGASPSALRKYAKILKRQPTIEDVKIMQASDKKVLTSTGELVGQHKGAKVLLLDIETAPIKAYVWGLWKQNISWSHVTNDWFIICWAAKWLDDVDVHSACVSPIEALNENDSNILKPLWDLLEEADVVVTHNGDQFDIPRINSRFAINNMTPPSPYYRIDTCKVARKQFAFTSNKLDALAHYFGFEGKYDTDFELWEGCLNGDRKSLQEMQEYNIQDVKVLEEVFLKLRPWITNFPNANNYLASKTIVCTTCGGDNLEELRNQFYYTTTGKYQLFRCRDCGAITKSRYNLNTPKNIKGTNIGR